MPKIDYRAKTTTCTILGVTLHVIAHPKGFQWGIRIEGDQYCLRPQIVKIENYAGKKYWRLRPGSLPGAFNEQFHTSLDDALKKIAELYNKMLQYKGENNHGTSRKL